MNAAEGDEQLLRWLYGFDDAGWNDGIATRSERAMFIYTTMQKVNPNIQSELLNRLCHNTIASNCKSLPPVLWEDQGSTFGHDPPTGPPASLAEHAYPCGHLPPLVTDAEKRGKGRIIKDHNDIMNTVRGMRLKRRSGSDDIVKALVKPCELGRELVFIKSSFVDHDTGLSIGRQRVPLSDPFSQTRMIMPARGGNCNHLTCFDLFIWGSQVIKQKCPAFHWNCPICKEMVYLGHVYISPYFLHVLEVCYYCCFCCFIKKKKK